MFIREMTVTVLRWLDSRNDGEMMAVLAYEGWILYSFEHEDYIARRRACADASTTWSGKTQQRKTCN